MGGKWCKARISKRVKGEGKVSMRLRKENKFSMGKVGDSVRM